MDYVAKKDQKNHSFLEVGLSDYALISHPLLNKGMSFTPQERDDFHLHGLLPPHEATLEEQCQRSYESLQIKTNNVDKYIYLRSLQDSNEILFYRLLHTHIAEMMPLVYTPTVGAGCQHFSHLYRRPRGVFISYPNQNRMDEILANPRFDNVEVIVVSDGERILGLGDQGAGGMGIPIGKLSLYTACAGIHPRATLPILLDTGTDNAELINDPLYIGWKHERIRGEEYDNFIEDFIKAIKKRFPNVLLQWEDFAQRNANPLLAKYRDQLCTFNDDIQGTAAVAAGTLLAAVQAKKEKICEQKIVVAGAGSAGCGISDLIKSLMIEEGLTEAQACAMFYLIDRQGLLQQGMDLQSFQQPFAQEKSNLAHWQVANANNISLLETIKNVKPTVLIGVSGQPGIFNEEIIKTMAANVKNPIIFPLSNPNTRCEATPADIMKWTNQQAIIGTGSPFPDTSKNGKPWRIDQTNNCYIFPGMGLGLIAVKAKRVTDKMFIAAARALANCSPAKQDANANLLPPLSDIREVSLKVALAVAEEAVQSGMGEAIKNLEQTLRAQMWIPEYLPYQKSLIYFDLMKDYFRS